MDPQATAGRIVHYYGEDSRTPRAAIVNIKTDKDGTAELTVFTSVPPTVMVRARYSENPAPGCWSWMPYQKAKAAHAGGNQSESAEPRPA